MHFLRIKIFGVIVWYFVYIILSRGFGKVPWSARSWLTILAQHRWWEAAEGYKCFPQVPYWTGTQIKGKWGYPAWWCNISKPNNIGGKIIFEKLTDCKGYSLCVNNLYLCIFSTLKLWKTCWKSYYLFLLFTCFFISLNRVECSLMLCLRSFPLALTFVSHQHKTLENLKRWSRDGARQLAKMLYMSLGRR